MTSRPLKNACMKLSIVTRRLYGASGRVMKPLHFIKNNEPFKVELVGAIPADETVTFYQQAILLIYAGAARALDRQDRSCVQIDESGRSLLARRLKPTNVATYLWYSLGQ